MFKVPTVLVLGAGASWHYGYPLGAELIDEIVKFTTDTKHDYLSFESKRLGKDLDFYDPVSIDSFLAFRSSDERLVSAGKYEIARNILSHEKKQHFHRSNSPRGNWYKYIASAILDGVKDPTELLDKPLNLKIITFNYDLSLEYYLYSRFNRVPTFSEQKIQDFLNILNNSVIHFYGQIGKFEWQGGTRKNEEYGVFENRPQNFTDAGWVGYQDKYINSVYQQIRLIGERSLEKNKAHQALQEAERIYFLGFGFNNDNNSELDIANSCKTAKDIYYTNTGNSKIIRTLAEDVLFNLWCKKIDGIYEIQGSREVNGNLEESEKDVYKALKFDFAFN